MFLDENGEPKDYLKQYLEKEGLDWDNSFENDEERLSYLESLITIYNIFNDDERIIEPKDKEDEDIDDDRNPHEPSERILGENDN